MVNIESGIFTCSETWLTKTLNIAVVGVGATGSSVATMLYKLNHIRREVTDNQYGINVTFFDPKNVTATGANRTGFIRSEIGMNKATTMANKLNNANGSVFAYGSANKFSLGALKDPSKLDVIITATDSASSRNQIAQMGNRLSHQPIWLDIGVGGSQGNIVLGELGTGKHRLPNVSDLFAAMKDEREDKDLNRASCDILDAITRQAFSVNETGASMAIGLLSRLVIYGSLTTHAAIYDISNCLSTPININRTAWKSFGYLYRKNTNAVSAFNL